MFSDSFNLAMVRLYNKNKLEFSRVLMSFHTPFAIFFFLFFNF